MIKRKPLQVEYGIPRVSDAIAKLFFLVKAKESTRYSLNYVCVDEKRMTVTDGWRLLSLELPHEVFPGMYFLTKEGFLLRVADDEAGKFPKYDEIISKTTREICHLTELDDLINDSTILFTLARAGVCINHAYFFPLTKTLDKIACDFSVQVEDREKEVPDPNAATENPTMIKVKAEPGDYPVKITAGLKYLDGKGFLTMIIMPVNIDKKYRN